METKSVITGASCKYCGGTVLIEVTGVPINMSSSSGKSGGVMSKPCSKCRKTCSYVYQIKNGNFTSLR